MNRPCISDVMLKPLHGLALQVSWGGGTSVVALGGGGEGVPSQAHGSNSSAGHVHVKSKEQPAVAQLTGARRR